MTKIRMAGAMTAIAVVTGVAGFVAGSHLSLHAAPQGQVHRVGDGTSRPKLVKRVEPSYTQEARDAELEGTVVLETEVWPDGRAHNTRVARGLGLGLDEEAIKALEQWEFEPGIKEGEPVRVRATIEMNFRL